MHEGLITIGRSRYSFADSRRATGLVDTMKCDPTFLARGSYALRLGLENAAVYTIPQGHEPVAVSIIKHGVSRMKSERNSPSGDAQASDNEAVRGDVRKTAGQPERAY